MQVVRMSRARGMRDGKGYSFSYVHKVIVLGIYANEEIQGLHQELVALRTPAKHKPTTKPSAK